MITNKSLLAKSAKISRDLQKQNLMCCYICFLSSIIIWGFVTYNPIDNVEQSYKPVLKIYKPCSMVPSYLHDLDQLKARLKNLQNSLQALEHSNDFEKAVNYVLKIEGGYGIDNNNYPVNFGINQKWYTPLKGFPLKVKDLTKTQAIQYYKKHYWDTLPFNPKHLPLRMSIYYFDTAVNKGMSVCKRIYNICGSDYECAIAERKAHLEKWFASKNTGTCKQNCFKTLLKRASKII